MISPGCSVSFDGLKQTLLVLEGGIEKKLKQVEHLLVNYRTTKDILMMGNQILATARAFFPGAIDFAKPEIARKDLGLKVALCSWKTAFKAKAKFGDDQAFIYSSNKPGYLLRDAMVWLENHPYILTSLESKGLEFLDIGEQAQILRDLISSNLLEACGALLAMTTLITANLVGTVSPRSWACSSIRKKQRGRNLAPETVKKRELDKKVRKVICDRDLAVMGATLNVIKALARVDVQPFKDLVSSLISIPKQICERRLPSEFDCHRIPASWMQMKIVRILSVIGKNDATSHKILLDCLRKAGESGSNASNAIVYECIRCITNIYPNPICWMRRGLPFASCPLESKIQVFGRNRSGVHRCAAWKLPHHCREAY